VTLPLRHDQHACARAAIKGAAASHHRRPDSLADLDDDWFTIASMAIIPLAMLVGAVLGTYLAVIVANTVLPALAH
jgi:hypothetical protein